jgi:hypothetical protein
VYQLLNHMSYVEYALWSHFFASRPIGWREDDRAFKIMKSFGGEIKPEQAFSSLATMAENERKKNPLPVVGTFWHKKLMEAKGGDKLEILKDLK